MATMKVKLQVGDGGVGPDFSELPEGCIATILSFTTPQDACRQSIVSSAFKSACDSDTVWSAFLPSDYESILASVSPSPCQFSSLKDLYFSLCDNPIPVGDGKMSFSLDRRSGKKCVMLSARTLSIAWGDTPMYWSRTPSSDSRFADVAELIIVCWLEIRGKISSGLLSPGTHYAAYLVFKCTPSAFGFGKRGLKVGAGFVGDEGGNQGRRVHISSWNYDEDHEMWLPPHDGAGDYGDLSTERRDGWSEVKLGEFFVEEGEHREVEMSVLETEALHAKGGLIVDGIEVRPKETRRTVPLTPPKGKGQVKKVPSDFAF